MKNIKKLLAVLLSVAVIGATLISVVSADTALRLEVTPSATELQPGDEFTLTVAIAENPGIWSVNFSVELDHDAFEFVSAALAIDARLELPYGEKGFDDYEDNYLYKFNGASMDTQNNFTGTIELVTLTYKVADDAKLSDYSVDVTIDPVNTIDVDSNQVPATVNTVTLTLSDGSSEPGVTEPEVTEPEVTEPEVTEPEVTEPEVTEPEVTEPEVTEPEVTEPDNAEVPDTDDNSSIYTLLFVLAVSVIGIAVTVATFESKKRFGTK